MKTSGFCEVNNLLELRQWRSWNFIHFNSYQDAAMP